MSDSGKEVQLFIPEELLAKFVSNNFSLFINEKIVFFGSYYDKYYV